MIKVVGDNKAKIEIGHWEGYCALTNNYWDDIPYRLIDVIDYTIRTRAPGCVQFNGCGDTYIIVFNVLNTHIISKNGLHTVNISVEDIAKELLYDLSADIKTWSEWGNRGYFEIEDRKIELKEWCDIIKQRIKKGLDKS